jgi:diguanylate cyclase (GGDEF)-like protein/PAS domain S-box-containing protein
MRSTRDPEDAALPNRLHFAAMKALVVIADPALQRKIEEFFKKRQHPIQICTSSAEGLAALDQRAFQFLIVDLTTDAEALTLCKRGRERCGDQIFILVIPKSETPTDLRAALEAGADDYLTPPLNLTSLQLRLVLAERGLAARVLRSTQQSMIELHERRYRSLIETMHEGFFQVDSLGTVEFANSRLSEITGYSISEIVGQVADNLLVEETIRDRLPGRTLLGTGIGSEEYTIPLRNKHEKSTWVKLTAAPVITPDGRSAAFGVVQDITEQRQAEEGLSQREAILERERAFFQQLFRNSPAGIVILDNGDRVVDANRAFVDLFQFEVNEIAGRKLGDFLVPERLESEAAEISGLVASEQAVERETIRQRRDGSEVDVSILAYPIELKERRIGAYAIFSDIGERKQAERKLYHEAFHDALTGLPNRTLLTERLERDLRRARRRSDYQFALMFIDLDRFKSINDTLGHAAGDELLQEMARRLESCLRPGDTTARLGGDEFVLILEDIKEVSDATRVAERVLESLAEPFRIAGQDVRSSGSIGIAFSETGYERAEDLMRDADIAMYRAKTAGKARFEIFDTAAQKTAAEKTLAETELRAALEKGELTILYQPIVSLTTGRVAGFEALLRWRHATRGLIMPAELMTLGEDAGMMKMIGHFVLDLTFRQLGAWRLRFPEHESVALHVNLAAAQMLDGDFLGDLDRLRRTYAIHPAEVTFEIPESLIIAPEGAVAELLWNLQKRGYRLAINDFGLATSCLAALHRLPIDALKIDQSLVEVIEPGGEHLEMVRAVAAVGESFGLRVIAEGIETQAQLGHLKEIGLTYIQGFLFSPPISAAEATELITTNKCFTVNPARKGKGQG